MAKGQDLSKQRYSNGGTSTNATFGTAPAAGSGIVVQIGNWHSGGGDEISSVTDNQGNTYTRTVANSNHSNGSRCYQYRSANISTGATFTITINFANSSGEYGVWSAVEETAMDTTSEVDISGSEENTSSADANVNPMGTTTNADDMIVGGCYISVGSSDVGLSASAATGYTNIALEQDANTYGGVSIDYKHVSSTGAQTIDWTHTVNGDNSACAGAYKYTAGGGGADPIPQRYYYRSITVGH